MTCRSKLAVAALLLLAAGCAPDTEATIKVRKRLWVDTVTLGPAFCVIYWRDVSCIPVPVPVPGPATLELP